MFSVNNYHFLCIITMLLCCKIANITKPLKRFQTQVLAESAINCIISFDQQKHLAWAVVFKQNSLRTLNEIRKTMLIPRGWPRGFSNKARRF